MGGESTLSYGRNRHGGFRRRQKKHRKNRMADPGVPRMRSIVDEAYNQLTTIADDLTDPEHPIGREFDVVFRSSTASFHGEVGVPGDEAWRKTKVRFPLREFKYSQTTLDLWDPSIRPLLDADEDPSGDFHKGKIERNLFAMWELASGYLAHLANMQDTWGADELYPRTFFATRIISEGDSIPELTSRTKMGDTDRFIYLLWTQTDRPEIHDTIHLHLNWILNRWTSKIPVQHISFRVNATLENRERIPTEEEDVKDILRSFFREEDVDKATIDDAPPVEPQGGIDPWMLLKLCQNVSKLGALSAAELLSPPPDPGGGGRRGGRVFPV